MTLDELCGVVLDDIEEPTDVESQVCNEVWDRIVCEQIGDTYEEDIEYVFREIEPTKVLLR